MGTREAWGRQARQNEAEGTATEGKGQEMTEGDSPAALLARQVRNRARILGQFIWGHKAPPASSGAGSATSPGVALHPAPQQSPQNSYDLLAWKH